MANTFLSLTLNGFESVYNDILIFQMYFHMNDLPGGWVYLGLFHALKYKPKLH